MLFTVSIEEALALAHRVDPKYAPDWQSRPAEDQAARTCLFPSEGGPNAACLPLAPSVREAEKLLKAALEKETMANRVYHATAFSKRR